MAAVRQAPNEEELERLREIFLKAETGIINKIGRLRSAGNVDYHRRSTWLATGTPPPSPGNSMR